MRIFLVGVFSDISDNIGQDRALRRIGHDVVEFDYKRHPEDMFVRICLRDKFDLAILNKCQHYPASSIKACQEAVRTVYWYMDPVVSMARGVGIIEKAKVCHAAAASRRGVVKEFLKVNPNSFHIHEGFDPVFNKPIVDIVQDIDVSFIGQIRTGRIDYLNKLKFHVFTDAYNERHSMAVCRSKINLNFSEGCGTSNRIYKLMASGGFALTQKYDGVYEDFEVGKELDVFEDVEDLRGKIDFYLKNADQRIEIAKAGLKAVQKYSWANWAESIVKIGML